MSRDRPSSVSIMVSAEPVVRALREAGLTEQAMAAIIRNPVIALATAQAAKLALSMATNDANAELRREALALPIQGCSELDTGQKNLLRTMRIITIGDLALTTERELSMKKRIGPKAMMNIYELLASYSLQLLVDDNAKLTQAAELYGGAEYIPARQMRLWTKHLDKSTLQYLQERGSIGELVATSGLEYMAWRFAADGTTTHQAHHHLQLDHIRYGLQEAGLSLRGE